MTLTIWQRASTRQLNKIVKRFSTYFVLLILLTACASDPSLPVASERAEDLEYRAQAAYNKPYSIRGKTYYPLLNAEGYVERGIASWYGAESGNRTAMGARFNPNLLTAAHKTLPLPCKAKVTNLRNGRSITVTVNDRGPFHDKRLIDLSMAAARQLGVKGLAEVEVQYVSGSDEDS